MKNFHKIFLVSCLFTILYLSFYLNSTRQDKNAIIIREKEKYNFKKYAVLSVSILLNRDYYYFQLPAIVKSWSRIGFNTIIIIVTSELPIKNELALKTIEYLNKFGAKLIYLKSPFNYEVTLSMVSRLYIGALTSDFINDNDFLITSDSDLYPINKDYYLNNEIFEKKKNFIFIWNAFCCGSFKFMNKLYSMFPIAHIGARKSQWIEIMNLNKETKFDSHFMMEDLKNFLVSEKMTLKENDKIEKGDYIWYLDQHLISIRISNYTNSKKDNILYKMHYSGLRFDRDFYIGVNNSNRRSFIDMVQTYNFFKAVRLFLTDFNILKFTDFHSFQENVYTNIDKLEKMYLILFDRETNILLKKYHHEFMGIKIVK